MDIEEQYDKIFRYCYYRVHSRETAEDLTQETFLRFLESGYSKRCEELPILYTIARNLCIDEMRRKKPEALPEELSDQGFGDEEMHRRFQTRQALSRMTEEDRELLILRYMNGGSMADISNITGLSRFALYRRLNRAKKIFITLMEGGDTFA